MEILDYFPIILTKDPGFLERSKKIKTEEGAIIILPYDAILIKPKKETK